MTRLLILTALLAIGCSDTVESSAWSVQEPDPMDQNNGAPNIPEPGIPAEPDPTTNPLTNAGNDYWVGFWRVDQPAHALYEGTVYNFREDGVLIEERSFILGGGELPHTEVGTVGRCAESRTDSYEVCEPDGTCEIREYTSCIAWEPTCTFGDRWGSESETVLLIEGDCSDDRARIIRLEFPVPAGSPATVPIRIEVEGEEWEHNWFDWQWERCPDDVDDCLHEF